MPESEGSIVYSTREILDSINEKLAKGQVAIEQFDKRLTGVEARVAQHDKILTEQLPRFQKVVEELDVKGKVEAALDSRKIRGISRRDQVIATAVGLLILALAILQYLPHMGGHQ